MPQHDADFPPPLAKLAALVGEKLGGPLISTTVIDKNLVSLALRHQVGPMLFAAAARHVIGPALLGVLEQSYRTSAQRRAATLDFMARMAAQFSACGISWLAIKGTTQAAQLYADPVWRESADIDILVAPREFGRAIDALSELGLVASYPPIPAAGPLRAAALAAVRDVMLVAPHDTRCSVELHQRLFFAAGRHADFLCFAVEPGAIPIPAIGPELAFFLIAHGAISYWVRLKWLTDIAGLLVQLDQAQYLALRDLARRARAENSLAASLLLLQALFGFAVPASLAPWLNGMRNKAAVRRRFGRYVAALADQEEGSASPLSHALTSLEANLLFSEALSTRAGIVAMAPLSSLVRRAAGFLMPAERALTCEG